MKTCDFDVTRIRAAILSVLNGATKKCVINNHIKVYECKDVIRVDLKILDDEDYDK